MRFLTELKFAARNLRGAPGFTAAAVITLALGIGASTAVFSAVDAVLLHPLPFRDPGRIVVMWETAPERNLLVREVSYRNFIDWRDQSQAFEGMAALGSVNWSLLRENAAGPARVPSAAVSAAFFDMVGASPTMGRAFTAEEDRRGAARVVVLSHGFWQRELGGAPGAVGTTIRFDGQPFTIVGVMPAGFDYPKDAQVWTPLVPALASAEPHWKVDALEARGFGVLYVLGRFKPTVTVEQAAAELDGLVRRLPESGRAASGGSVVVLTPLVEQVLGQARPALLLLFVLVGLVLFIACANVVGLLLTRATGRRRDVAVRVALGASRTRILQVWLAESALIAGMAGALGLAIAGAGLRGLLALAPADVPHLDAATIDWRVLTFGALLSLSSAIVCAVVPATQSSAWSLAATLREATSTEKGRVRRIRGLVIVTELAVTLTLLVGAGLLVRSFVKLRQLDLGFAPQRVLALSVEPLAETSTEYRATYDAILERVATLPGVQAAGAVYLKPLAHGSVGLESGYLLEGQSIDRPESWKDNVNLNYQAVTPGYFGTLRIALVQGRLFSELDTAASPGVAVVGERTARRLWPGESPIGKRISIAAGRNEQGQFPWQTVIGVVRDVRYRGLDDVRLDVYMPATQTQSRVKHLLVRTTSDPLATASAVRSAIRDVTRRAVVESVTTMDDVVADVLAPWRFTMTMLLLLAAIGVVLAAVGLFALVAYSVAQRGREIAIRLALGAEAAQVRRMVVWHAGRWTMAGMAAGGALSFALAPAASTMLFQVGPRDLWTFGAAAALLSGASVLASYLAARRVSRVEPLTALRGD